MLAKAKLRRNEGEEKGKFLSRKKDQWKKKTKKTGGKSKIGH